MKNNEIEYKNEYIYTVAFIILFGLKAIGLDEKSILFVIPMFIAIGILVLKLLLEKHGIYEWIVFLILGGFGLYTAYETKSYGLLIFLVILIGSKNIDRRFLFRILAIEYIICFLINTILAITGIREGVVLLHEKFGTELVRRSLGYTHPNVLQITYVVIMVLVLYGFNVHGNKLVKVMLTMILIDIGIFIFSLSFTGAIMSVALLVSWSYMELVHYRNNKPFSIIEKYSISMLVPAMMIAPFAAAYLVRFDQDGIYRIANKFFNMRLWCINRYINLQGITLFGSGEQIERVAIDCSYAYLLIRYGLIFTILIFVCYFMTTCYLVRNNLFYDAAIMLTFVFAGMSEQFMFNASIKNLTVFMVGEWMYYEFEKVKKC